MVALKGAYPVRNIWALFSVLALTFTNTFSSLVLDCDLMLFHSHGNDTISIIVATLFVDIICSPDKLLYNRQKATGVLGRRMCLGIRQLLLSRAAGDS